MILSIPADKAPLLKYQGSVHLMNIRRNELIESLSARGVDIVGGGEGVIVVSLRNLIPNAGSIEAGKIELLAVLRELNVDAVTFQAEDPAYILGNGITAHMLGRGIESQLPGIQRILSDVPIDESVHDGAAVPIFDRLGEATAYAMVDQIPEGANKEMVIAGATRDLFHAGLIDHSDSSYRDWLTPKVEEPPPLPSEFQTTPRKYKSLFDRSEGY